MRREITRTDLYERVWTESVGAVAKEYGISDVALAKICKKNNIPLPPRGYWAKLRAGKRLPKTRLTERALGGAEILELGKEDDWRRQTDADIRAAEELLLNTPVPERVVFAETIEDVRARVRRLVGQVKVEKCLF